MAQQTLNATAGGPDDNLPTATAKLNSMFGELYALQSSTLNAADPRFAGATREISINNAINMPNIGAVAIGAQRLFIPNSMLPFDATQVVSNVAVRQVREGGDFTVYDVRAYGAAGDDVQIDDASFIAADAQARLAGGTLDVPDCDVGYKITTTITIGGNNRRWRQDPAGLIKCYNATGPAIKFSGASAGGTAQAFLHVWGLSIQAAASGYKQPLVQFGDAASLSWFSIEDVKLDGNSLPRDGLWLHTAFNGSLKDVFITAMGGGRGTVYRNDPAINSGNINFINVVDDNPVGPMFAIQEYYGVATNLINSLHFDNCKAAGAGYANKFFAGTLAGNQAINSLTIMLTGGQGANYAAGDWIVVIHGGAYWTDKVTSVAGDVLTLTDPAGTAFALSTGDPVIVGAWHTVLGPNVKNVTFDVPHFERTNGVLGTNSYGVSIDNALFGANVYRGAYLAQSCQMWTMRRPRGTAAGGTIVFHQANDAANSRNALEGSVQADFSGSTPTMIQIDGGSYVGWNSRLGLQETLLGVWHQDTTVAANQAGVQLTGPMGAVRTLRMSTYGSVTRIVAAISTPRSAGTLTVTVFKTGSSSTLTAVIDGSNTTYKITENTNPGSVLAFVPGDTLDIRVTTDAAWLPIANNLDVAVYGTM